MTSDDKKQKDKPKLVPHQNVQVAAGEKVKKAKQSSEITKGQTRSEKIWVAVEKGERIGV